MNTEVAAEDLEVGNPEVALHQTELASHRRRSWWTGLRRGDAMTTSLGWSAVLLAAAMADTVGKSPAWSGAAGAPAVGRTVGTVAVQKAGSRL